MYHGTIAKMTKTNEHYNTLLVPFRAFHVQEKLVNVKRVYYYIRKKFR